MILILRKANVVLEQELLTSLSAKHDCGHALPENIILFLRR